MAASESAPLLKPIPNDVPMTDWANEVLCLAEGYEHYLNGSCYTLKTDKKDWDDAKADCEEDGGHLVVINSDWEFQYMTEIVTAWTWVGLNDKAIEDTFEWVDMTSHDPDEHRHWWYDDTQPDNLGNQDCVQLLIRSGNTGLDDYGCSNTLDYICEKEL